MDKCNHCFCKVGKGYTDNYVSCCKCGKSKPLFDTNPEDVETIHKFVKQLNKSIQK